MAIAKNKRRYALTLTPAIVDRFQALCEHFGLPIGTMSNAVDDSLKSLSDALQAAKDQGQLSNDILWRLMGKQWELIKDEKGEGNVSKQKRNTVLNGKNAR